MASAPSQDPARAAESDAQAKREARKRLDKAVERVLGSAMGARYIFPGPGVGFSPMMAALAWLGGYAVVGLLAAVFLFSDAPSDPRLVSLLVWGGFYCSAAIYLAQSATVRIKETVRCDIADHASTGYMDAVAADLKRHYPYWLLFGVTFVIAMAALGAAWWVLGGEIASMRRLSGELVFWVLTYFLHFYCAAVAVIAAGFYSCFVAHLYGERRTFYVLGAADTPLVRGVERLSTEVLKFWSLVFLLVLSSMLLALLPPDGYRLAEDSAFLFILIPLAGFFSLGVGTLIHLSTDAKIRAVLHRFTHEQAGALQQLSGGSFDPAARRVPTDPAETDRLTAWHDRIIAGGRYGSRTGTAVSIALPLILPVVGLLVEIFGAS